MREGSEHSTTEAGRSRSTCRYHARWSDWSTAHRSALGSERPSTLRRDRRSPDQCGRLAWKWPQGLASWSTSSIVRQEGRALAGAVHVGGSTRRQPTARPLERSGSSRSLTAPGATITRGPMQVPGDPATPMRADAGAAEDPKSAIPGSNLSSCADARPVSRGRSRDRARSLEGARQRPDRERSHVTCVYAQQDLAQPPDPAACSSSWP